MTRATANHRECDVLVIAAAPPDHFRTPRPDRQTDRRSRELSALPYRRIAVTAQLVVQYRHELIRILAGDFYQRRALLSPRWRLQLAYGCLLGFSNSAFAWAAAMTRLRPCPTSRPCIGQSAALTVRVARKLLFLLDAA